MLEYKEKKSLGYDMSEVEKTLGLLKKAKDRGDKSQFIQLLKKI